MEKRIAPEVAESEFNRFAKAMDLDVDVNRMDGEDQENFRKQKRRVTRAIEDGHLVIDDDGQPVFTPQLGDKTPLTFHEPTGSALMSMDKRKEGENVAKTYTTLGEMTKTSAAHFASMNGRDLKVCQALYVLFLS